MFSDDNRRNSYHRTEVALMEKIKYKTRHSKQMELHANVDDNEYLQYTKLLIWKWEY